MEFQMTDQQWERPCIHRGLIAALLLFFVLVYLFPLGVRPMISPDESRYAEIPREMLASDNWLVPTLCGVPYFEKPALGYQTTALSFLMLGENLFALRLPNVLAVALTALFLYLFFIRTTRQHLLSTLAAVLYLTSGMVIVVGMFAVPDSQLTAALSISLGAFYLAWNATRKREILFWLVLSGMACGAAFQIKGFLAFVIPALVLTVFLIWMKDWKRLLLYPWIPIVVAVLVSLPWALAIHQKEPGFWHYFFIEEHVHRFLSGTHDKNAEPFYYFIPILLTGLLPAGGTIVCAWSGWRTKDFWTQPIPRFLLCWLVLPFLFFSISSCKTGTYILPCFPAAAALLAVGIWKAFQLDPEKARRQMSFFFSCLGGVTFIGGVVTIILFPLPWHQWFPKIHPLYPEGYQLGYLATSLCILWGALLFMTRKKTVTASMIFFPGLAPVLLSVFLVLPIGLLGHKAAAYGLEKGLEHLPIQKDDMIFVEGGGTIAYVWTLKRTDFLYINPPREISFWFDRNRGQNPGPIFCEANPEQLKIILAQSPEKKSIFITDRNLKKHPLSFPRPVEKEYSFQGISIYRF